MTITETQILFFSKLTIVILKTCKFEFLEKYGNKCRRMYTITGNIYHTLSKSALIIILKVCTWKIELKTKGYDKIYWIGSEPD